MLNVALVGFGYWGPNIARNINNNPNLNLHTICDMIDGNLEKAHKIYASSTNYEKDFKMWQLCSNGKVDGINGNVDIDIMYK